MIKNYLKIAWRNLVKNKAHSFINIVGLVRWNGRGDDHRSLDLG